MKIHNKRGFSLIELLASVLIVAILVAIALPMYEKAITKSRTAEVNNLLTMVRTRQIRKFARDKEYATEFTDQELKKIAYGDNTYEVNNGAFKMVDNNYQLELRNVVDPETNITQRCVIGRYKPNNGDAQFAFAIAYDKNGLACDDKSSNPNEYTKEVCDMFGTVVSDIDTLCSGQAPGMIDLCPNTCSNCQFADPSNDCACVDNPPLNMPPNYIFDRDDLSCQSCKYKENNAVSPFELVVKQIDTTNHTITTHPQIHDQLFSCNSLAAAFGDTTADATASGFYINCHSSYFMEWDTHQCDWVCRGGSDALCKEGEKWNGNLCKCVCDGRCHCHETQYLNYLDETENCVCLDTDDAPNGVDILPNQQGCVCSARSDYGENQGDRVLTNDFLHCKCDETERSPVYFGTITDPHHITHDVNIPNASTVANNEEYWKAACCLTNDVWAKGTNGFAYDACCPFTDYLSNDGSTTQSTSKHIEFNVSTTHCCPAGELFYNAASSSSNKTDPNPTQNYSARPAGTVGAQICHQCEHWYQAYNSEVGCYTCPGKTFTTWNDSENVSKCSCPTGTEGDVRIYGGHIGEDCLCKKLNTNWVNTIAYVNYAEGQGLGNVGDNVWHANNGACKCMSGYKDTYLGLQLPPSFANTQNPSLNGIGTVSANDGYCCSNALATNVYDDNNQVVSGQKACCPKGRRYFHNTTYADKTCGVCMNQTYTVVGYNAAGGAICQPCPGNMVPRYNPQKGYAECECPTGMHVDPDRRTQGGQLVDVCICDMANATWTAPSGWVSAYITNYIIPETPNSEAMPAPWDSVNGYCQCKQGYEFATYGNINTNDGTTDGTVVPSTGYCCPQGQCHQTTTYDPQRSYCCDANIAFNLESDNAGCCKDPAQHYYYSLSQLASHGLTTPGRAAAGTEYNGVAQHGGCARCDDPKKDQNCDLCNSKNKTDGKKVPRVPVWNNSYTDGFSTCVCPAGTQEERPSWWQSFLTAIHALSWDPDCYCEAENSVWDKEKQKCVCEGAHFVLAQDTNGSGAAYCCPKDKPSYTVASDNTTGCCPSSTPYYYEGQCRKCPESAKYYWYSDRKCHFCPQGQYQYGTVCCANNLGTVSNSETITTVTVGNHEYCTTCSSCGQNCGTGATTQWNSTTNQAYCSCDNGATYQEEAQPDPNNNNALTHCPLTCAPNPTTQCGCNACANQTGNTDNMTWNTTVQQCTCSQTRRHFVSGCCTNSSIACCQCNSGYVETTLGSSAVNNCCATDEVAPNNSSACCGKTHANVAIHYNEYSNTCCTQDKPYYSSTKRTCSRCPNPDTQYWNSKTENCLDCNQPRILGGWDDTIAAYTTCSCPQGTSATGQGGVISGDNVINNKAPCKCLLANTVWDTTQQKCVCSSGYHTIYAQDGYTVSECCPNNKYISATNTCCATTESIYSYSQHQKCCTTNTNMHLYPYGTNLPADLKCSFCPSNQIWNTKFSLTSSSGGCKNCDTGMVPDTNSWSSQYLAYTRCICDASANLSSTATGGTPSDSSSCHCPEGQYYMDMHYQQAAYGQGSCKACPGNSTWDPQSNQCVCKYGWGLSARGCECTGTNHPFSKLNTLSCNYDANNPNCVCSSCPTNTSWVTVNNQSACYCNLSVGGKSFNTSGNNEMVMAFRPSQHYNCNTSLSSKCCGISQSVSLNGTLIGYCNYHCANGNAIALGASASGNTWLCYVQTAGCNGGNVEYTPATAGSDYGHKGYASSFTIHNSCAPDANDSIGTGTCHVDPSDPDHKTTTTTPGKTVPGTTIVSGSGR